ncbi:YheC/YheD family protein [Brevibacillus borstelensis]
MKAPNVGKWTKHLVMDRDRRLKEYLPETVLFEPESLWTQLEKYGSVMLKPSGGGGGAGIIKVTSLEDSRYQVHAGNGRKIVSGKEETVRYVRSLFIPKPYLIQPYLSLGRIGGCPFDVRVMIQRYKGKPWVVTGFLAKLAGPGFIVTNIARSRGKVLPLTLALARSNVDVPLDLLEEIKHVAQMTGECLGKKYPTLRMVGLDLGIDTTGKPWIIEANFRPSMSLFRKLPDLRAYRRIVKFRSK